MNKRFVLASFLLAILSAVSAAGTEKPAQPEGKQEGKVAAPKQGDPVSEAEYAWALFVAAMRPANGSLAFESWIEQCQLNPALVGCPSQAAAKGGRTLHASALGRALRKTVGASDAVSQGGIECSPMQTTPLQSGFKPPANVVASAQFCEEVFVNSVEAEFIKQNTLTTLTGQQAYGKAHGNAITFPKEAIEIKADWVPASSFSNPTFQCPDPTNSLYTETINGTCYALVGIHISSKALPDWVWATFEPASTVTNPNRCNPALYSTCFDPWGTTSKTPYGTGVKVPQSPQLVQLMKSANLSPAFNNYYLTGAQTQFVTSKGAPIPLGNSFVEFNANVDVGQASCITCHKYAYFDGKPVSPENNYGGPPTGWPAVGYACNKNQNGNCTPVTPNSISQDFSWILGLMPVK